MKDFVKFAAVGVAGYLIGFYEMKYKIVKAIADGQHEALNKKDSEEKTEGEAQASFFYLCH